MISGRGLSHTLEAIPGLSVSASTEEMTRWLKEVSCCIVGQTANLVPAHKRMYAVRDVTGTIDHFGLIKGCFSLRNAYI